MNYLTVVAVVKDEPDLPEWICWHLLAGVDRFLIYDNGSERLRPAEILAPFVDAGFVTVFPYPGHGIQFIIYTDALLKAGEDKWGARWFAFIDADEFLLPTHRNHTLVEALQSFESEAGVAIHWRMFGSNGHVQRPPGLVIENYTRCALRTDPHTKCIVDPRRVARCFNAHFFTYAPGAKCVDTLGDPVTGPRGSELRPHEHLLRINHYCVKSKADQALRILRGQVDVHPPNGAHERALVENEENSNAVEDLRAAVAASYMRTMLANYGYA